jgi:hypothetical protein
LSLSIGSQDYHGWQNRISRRFSNGLTVQAAYTLSKTLEEVSFLNNEFFQSRGSAAFPARTETAAV